MIDLVGDKLISMDHSHPGIDVSTLIPSGFDRSKNPLPALSGDRGAAKSIEKYFPGVTTKIYVPMTKEYIRYNSKKVF